MYTVCWMCTKIGSFTCDVLLCSHFLGVQVESRCATRVKKWPTPSSAASSKCADLTKSVFVCEGRTNES